MNIADLSYLENALENELILGGDGSLLEITANASAEGSPAYASTTVNIDIKTVGNGQVTIGKADGTSVAIGNDPIVNVSYDAQGFETVIVKNSSGTGENYAEEQLQVIAINTPGK